MSTRAMKEIGSLFLSVLSKFSCNSLEMMKIPKLLPVMRQADAMFK
jgi:hypothetical protein